MNMFDTTTDPFSFMDSPLNYDPSTAAAGLYAPEPIEATKKKPAKVHPCPHACKDKSGQPRLFTCQHNVQQHVREKHTLERPYKCEICDDSRRGFNRPFTYNRHMLMFHGIQTGPGKGHAVRRAKQTAPAPPAFGAPAAGQPDFDFDDRQIQEASLQIESGTNDAFAYVENRCHACKTMFFTKESMLNHLHIDHGQEPSPLCTCMACSSIYCHNAGDAAELKQQLEAGGFGVVDGSESPAGLTAGLEATIDFGQKYTLEEDHLPLLAKPGNASEGTFVDDVFAPPATGGGQDVLGTHYGAPTQGNDTFGETPQGLEEYFDFGDAAAYGGDESGFDGVDFSQLNNFNGVEGFDTDDMDMTEVFPDPGQAAGGAKQADALDRPQLYGFSSGANMAEADDILSRL
ncbi:hypothetical protein LTR85_004329 [Meristemomyces frigidus]|nr:hypothetical protein LTR85_004329 [Meristemomyces frigidus]